MATIAISCLIDDTPTMRMQAWNWMCSLDALKATERADIYVHYIDSMDPRRLQTLERLGARTVPVKPFGVGPARYCNKIRQLENLGKMDHEYVILTDADLAFLECPTELALGASVRAKPVDLPNPSEALWRQLLTEAALTLKCGTTELELVPGASTFATNFNGGLYVIPGKYVGVITAAWTRWAEFCLFRTEMLGQAVKHSDQLGFGMAVAECEIPFENLSLSANFPLHLRNLHNEISSRQLTAIHYHWEVDQHGLVNRVGIPWIDAQVDDLNKRIAKGRRKQFDNRVFWDFRYRKAPELGSGLGSRGQILVDKRAMLLPHLRAARGSVLDVGCGDLETMRYMPIAEFHGIDVSEEAIEIARLKRPDWRFDIMTVDQLPPRSYSLVTCLDVLFHQSDPSEGEALVNDLVQVAKDAVIVSGYSQPVGESGIVFGNRPVAEILKSNPSIARVDRIGGYRDVDVCLAVKHEAFGRNLHDIAPLDLATGMMLTSDWALLRELVALSRERLGFFPSTIIRSMEYPWFATRLASHAGDTVLDVGAGVSVLPFWLADKGCRVFTVDNHTGVRNPSYRDNWNEWGFLDYATLDPRIVSLNVDASIYSSPESFGAIYSVSVLEHVPAELRRRIFHNIKEQLSYNGCLYLSLDLIPETISLWLLSEGKTVEPAEIHGTLDDVLSELKANGFSVTELTVRRGIPGSRTDVALIKACHS